MMQRTKRRTARKARIATTSILLALAFIGAPVLANPIMAEPADPVNPTECMDDPRIIPLLYFAIGIPDPMVVVDTIDSMEERIARLVSNQMNPVEDEFCNAARVGCWDWNPTGVSSDHCTASRNKDFTRYGVYYCPAEGHTACRNNGAPTSGTVDVRVEWGSETAAFWCRNYIDGVGVDSCIGSKDRALGARVHGGSLFGQEIRGTYGGLYE